MTTENQNIDNINAKIIGWLDKNRDAFGRKVLLVGLDLRVATHIAHVFPEASLVFLTLEDPADLDNGLEQPLVIRSSLEDYDGGMFDTVAVFSSDPLDPEDRGTVNAKDPAANLFRAGNPCPQFNRGALYLYRASRLMEYYESAAGILRRNLREGGTLLSLVRSGHDEHLLGYSLALAAEGMEVSPSIRQILCREDGSRVTMQALRAVAGGRTDLGALIAENLNFNLDRMDTGAEELEGKKAEILLQADLSGLVRGYNVYQNDTLMGKLAVYTSASRKDVIYYFTDVLGDVPYLKRFHTDDEQKLKRHMLGELHRQKAADKNVKWCELVLNGDWSETETT